MSIEHSFGKKTRKLDKKSWKHDNFVVKNYKKGLFAFHLDAASNFSTLNTLNTKVQSPLKASIATQPRALSVYLVSRAKNPSKKCENILKKHTAHPYSPNYLDCNNEPEIHKTSQKQFSKQRNKKNTTFFAIANAKRTFEDELTSFIHSFKKGWQYSPTAIIL